MLSSSEGSIFFSHREFLTKKRNNNHNEMELNRILFLDIETVPGAAKYDDLTEQMQALWDKKARTMSEFVNFSENSARELYNRAAIYAEFGKIVCISVGIFSGEKFVLHSFVDKDEKKLLQDFVTRMGSWLCDNQHAICGHNAKEFDIPFIARRLLVNGLKLPAMLDIAGKKPWEIPHLDTMELWKFGDYKHFTSLELLATIFGLPTPKDDINGSQVGQVYWLDGDLQRISTYCQKDVLTTARLYLKLKGSDKEIPDTCVEIR